MHNGGSIAIKWTSNEALPLLPLNPPYLDTGVLVLSFCDPVHGRVLPGDLLDNGGNYALMERIYAAIVLNDYPDKHYATWVQEQKKTIETRMVAFKHRGPIVICCGNKSVTRGKGRALCIVDLYDVRPMTDSDAGAAMIENAPGRMAHLLRDWRYFSRAWDFKYYKVSGSFQSIFKIRIPDDVEIIEQQKVVPNFIMVGKDNWVSLDNFTTEQLKVIAKKWRKELLWKAEIAKAKRR